MLRGCLASCHQASQRCWALQFGRSLTSAAAAVGRKPRQQRLPAPDRGDSDSDSGRRFCSRGADGPVPLSSKAHASSSSSHSSSSSPGAPVRQQQQHPGQQREETQPQQAPLQPEPAGSFLVTAKELATGKGSSKPRLDAYVTAQLPAVSRAKISASIKAGLVTVNGRAVSKPSQAVKAGDHISVCLLPPEPCTAIPEAIPLDVVFEDGHLIVVNKAPGMVVHLSPGHTTGTLVNALLAHCGLPACDAVPSGSSGSTTSSSGGGLMPGSTSSSSASTAQVLGGLLDDGELDEAEEEDGDDLEGAGAGLMLVTPPNNSSNSSSSGKGIIRPGIVHRLDRGTSGLMVVAKTDAAHAALCQQFKDRSVSRIYNAITVGTPAPAAARVATNIVRDPSNRLRMMAVPYGSGRGRTAASNYQTLEVVADGGAALVQWRLETGRTHQIRVHARHIGHALLGDDMYGPNAAAASRQVIGKRSSLAVAAKAAIEAFGRPALHARTLGFTHPATGQRLEFASALPPDFVQLYECFKALAHSE